MTIKKFTSYTPQSTRKIKTKTGVTKTVKVKGHFNKVNRPGKKK